MIPLQNADGPFGDGCNDAECTRRIGYLFDLDGTVYRGEHLLDGAKHAITTLRSRGRRLLFVSNKPLHSRLDYASKLSQLGIPACEEDVINSSYVLATCLARRSPSARVFVIGEAPLLSELERAGLVLCDAPAQIDYVVAAFDRTFTYDKLNIGFQALRRGAHFVATNADRTCPVEDGEVPDAAAVIAALESTSGRELEKVFGKPSPEMVRVALDRLGVPAERCTMVGDRLETDIAMARENGLRSILTLTGVTTPDALEASALQPDYIVNNLGMICELDHLLEPLLLGRRGTPAGRAHMPSCERREE